MILGEAPGREEDAMGHPFVGASGKLLRSTLLLEKVPLGQCYITNTVKCFPHGTPKQNEINICSQNYLRKEIALLAPHYILACGRVALSCLNPSVNFSDLRGKLIKSWVGDALVFPIWHPAYILRNRSKESIWRYDISVFRALLEVDLKIGLKDLED
jgi:DNA polymerase